MKTYLLTAFLFFCFQGAYSQKNVSFGLGGNFSFGTKGLGLNEPGFGFHLQGNLFSRHSLQLRIESGLDYFFGDKRLVIDLSGNKYETNPTIKRILAGPEFFPNKKISVAALYGTVWNNWLNNDEAQDGLKVLFAAHLGNQKKFTPALSFTTLPGSSTHYFTVSVGYMFYK